jgi:hypothetical protein
MVAVTIDISKPFAGLATILASTVHGSGRIRVFSGNPETELLTELTRYAEGGDIIPSSTSFTPSTASPTPTGPWRPAACGESTSSRPYERGEGAVQGLPQQDQLAK